MPTINADLAAELIVEGETWRVDDAGVDQHAAHGWSIVQTSRSTI